MIQRLELSVAQRVEVFNVNDVGSVAVRIGELAAQQAKKREQFESPAS